MAGSYVIRVENTLSNTGSMDYLSLPNELIKTEHWRSFLVGTWDMVILPTHLRFLNWFLSVRKETLATKKSASIYCSNFFLKNLQALIHNQLSFYFEHNNLMSELQYGFRVGDPQLMQRRKL